ncbi:hypothetical protein WJX74_008944 [Apatococcus lobatus]|uniref:Peptidase M50 domain-containing protein n=1 Tax=Apatococcus lobatus TaxID=904363 RepID=A0AAW1QVP2_9CHLO
MSRTVSALEALLGIEEEKPKQEQQQVAPTPKEGPATEIDISPDVSEAVVKEVLSAEARRKASGGTASSSNMEKQISEQMVKVLETAKKSVAQRQKMSELSSTVGQKDPEALKEDFEQLMNMIVPERGIPKEDLARIKKHCFPQTSFWVTETRTGDELTQEGGVLIRGNVRGKADAILPEAVKTLKKMFGDKYELFMVEDNTERNEAALQGRIPEQSEARIAFRLVSGEFARPPPTGVGKTIGSAFLFLATFASCAQLGLLANVAKLPKETLDFLAQPQELDPGSLPPGLAGWDPSPLLFSSIPITAWVLGLQLLHDSSHRVVAANKKVKLGLSYLIPNGQIGTFGSTLPLKSIVKNHKDLFDIAIAGPAAGGAASLLLFIAGLALSQGNPSQDGLVSVPGRLFEGSLLLGGAAQAVLGSSALSQPNIMIHPTLIAGWCGLVTTALNCLPVGSLDGGRMTQAAFGKGALNVASLLTYIGLGLGLLGSSLAVPFGLFVLVFQRDQEKYIQDQFTPGGNSRRNILAVVLVLALLILLPVPPNPSELGDGLNI